jgi:FixJ family two-component response regulator
MPAERRVYVVDDDEAVRDSLSVLLESKAFAVRSFASRWNSWKPLRRFPPAV